MYINNYKIYIAHVSECKNYSEIVNTETFLSFLSNLMKKFYLRFKDFLEIGKTITIFKNSLFKTFSQTENGLMQLKKYLIFLNQNLKWK
jgi:hypothetical protein